MKKGSPEQKRTFQIALTVFLTGALLIIFYQIVDHFPGFKAGLGKFHQIISPFIYGFVMAYILSPIYNYVVKHVYGFTSHRVKSKKKAFTFARVIGSIVSAVVLIGALAGVIALIVPDFVRNLVKIMEDLPERITIITNYIKHITDGMDNPQAAKSLQGFIDKGEESVVKWAENKLPGLSTYMDKISEGVIMTLRTVFNIIIGMIACIYMLNGKEKFKAQVKKTILANHKKETADEIFNFAHFTDKTFGGFINGKIIDSIIIGILCYILMIIIHLPYTGVISTIVGITNIIPFFGPFIGAIPGALIILLVSPIQALYFLIMILGLQQLDGNVIGPAILGGTTGIASFWVMFSIVLGGGLFGFMGMVLGVPVFVIIYYYTGRGIDKRLAKKNIPEETDYYIDFERYGIKKEELLGNTETGDEIEE